MQARLRVGDFEIDITNRTIREGAREVAVEPRVFAVIACLLRKPGELVSRNDLLDSVWGHRYVTPSSLNRAVALARRALSDDSSDPRVIQTVHGAGYRLIAPLGTASETTNVVRFEPPLSARLPARMEPLVGREDDLAMLCQSVKTCRAITLTGAGGMGKTSCALEAARRMAGSFPDGVWFFDLSSSRHADEWPQMFGAALGIPTLERDALMPKLVAVLADRHALVVLDNCERVADELATLVFLLLRHADRLQVLATSQRPLHLVGESVLHLAPLRVPRESDLARLRMCDLDRYSGLQLLLRRVRAVQPGFELDDQSAVVFGEICMRLDGMPLALELAAARFALLSPPQVLERLTRRFSFLHEQSAGRAARHTNLQRLLEWSCGLLSAEERRLLCWCAIFVATWSADALIELARDLGHAPEAIVDLLTGLVHHSLVSVVTGVSPPRYRLLESVREFALTELGERGEEPAARAAHRRAMTAIAARAHRDMLCGRVSEGIKRLFLDLENFDVVFRHAATGQAVAPDPQVLDLLGSLLLYAKCHGDHERVRRWGLMILGDLPSVDSASGARALLTLGVSELHLGIRDGSRSAALEEAVRIARNRGDRWTEGFALGYLSLRLSHENRVIEARAAAYRLRSMTEMEGDELLEGLAALALGWVLLAQSLPEQGLVELERARTCGADPHQRHFACMYVGLAHLALSRDSAAAQVWLEGLHLSASVGNVRGIAGSIEGCGYLAARAGDWATAATLLAAARTIRERTCNMLFRFWVAPQAQALAEVNRHLSPADRRECEAQGALLRQEDVANETLRRLNQYSRQEGAAACLPASVRIITAKI